MNSPHELEVKQLEIDIAMEKVNQKLARGFQIADIFINKHYIDMFSNASIERGNIASIEKSQSIRIYALNKIVFDPAEDITDKLISIYNSLYNIESSVALFVVGDITGVEFYLSVRCDNTPNLAGELLESTLVSNFPGISLRGLNDPEIKELLDRVGENSHKESLLNGLSTVSLIPSIRDKDKKDQFIQGIEKLIYTLQGKSYFAVFLATPLSQSDINTRKQGYEKLYSFLSPHAKLSYTYGENQSLAVNEGISNSFTSNVNESVSNTNGESYTETEGTTQGSSHGTSYGGGSSGEGSSFNWGSNSSSSFSTNTSYSSGSNFSNTVSKSVGNSNTEGSQHSKTNTEGTSETKNFSFENKGVSGLMQKINQAIERINQWESYGLWESAAYFFSNEVATSVLAASSYKAIMTGEQTYLEKAHVNIWNGNRSNEKKIAIRDIFDKVRYLVHPSAVMELPKELENELDNQYVRPTCLVGGNELALLLGMPRKSVSGVAVQEMAEFGRAVVYENKKPEKKISIGNIYHMGIEDKSMPVEMDVDLFSSHCFITGSSGSGKSYTTYNLLEALLNQGIHMLVVEPAKGEYKTVFGGMKGVNIFITSSETYRLLRINPFQFPENTHILSHIEQLLQIFNASWPLYAAMPAILKESVVQAYVNCGWDIQKSIWIPGISEEKFPTFKNVLQVLPEIINISDYSADSKGDYKGALLTRVEAMTNGISGLIFNDNEGIADSVLFEQNTIVDLSDVGSEETIALIMGVLIMRLNEYRRSSRKRGLISSHDSGIRHITVLEEAHNLLKRTSKDQNQEGSNLVGKSVEMISNSIKEMRTYGEGFLIIDQSPLAVDASVIENTATKIVMNTPSLDACKELGSALALNENQTKELSRLNVGVAAVMQKGWLSPVLMKVGIWNGDAYEAPLQFASAGMTKYVRTMLFYEFVSQMRTGNYSIGKMRSLIRKSELDSDRRNELDKIVDLFEKYRKKNLQLSDIQLGDILINICDCSALFDVVPKFGLLSIEDWDKEMEQFNTNEDGEGKNRFISFQIHSVVQWIKTFINALDNYITVNEKEVYFALGFMLTKKESMSNIKKDIYTPLLGIYNNPCIKLGEIFESQLSEDENNESQT